MKSDQEFTVTQWPAIRNLTETVLDFQPRHTYHAWFTVNVTETTRSIARCQEACRITVSLHAYLIYCIARAASEHPAVISYRHRNQRIQFNHVDVGTALEKKQPDGTRIPTIVIFRRANTKSFALINWEFRMAARSDLTQEEKVKKRRRFMRMPRQIRRLIYKWMLRNPFTKKELYGNLQFTSLYQANLKVPLIGFPPNLGTVSMAAGSISETFLPSEKGEPTLSKIMHLSTAMNHDIVDGMDMAIFIRRVIELIENATGIDDDFIAETKQLKSGLIR